MKKNSLHLMFLAVLFLTCCKPSVKVESEKKEAEVEKKEVVTKRDAASHKAEEKQVNEKEVAEEKQDETRDVKSVLSFVPSNLKADFQIPAHVEDLIINSKRKIDTSRGYLEHYRKHKTFQLVEQDDSVVSQIGVFVVGDLTIGPNADISVEGSYPLMIIATGDVKISGSISASGGREKAGAGGFVSIRDSNRAGNGPGGGILGHTSSMKYFPGGGSYCGAGGKGADFEDFTTEEPNIYGNEKIIPLLPGSSGANGNSRGGGGGGAIAIVAAGSIEITSNGGIFASGGGGRRLDGGGSGGAILLEAPQIKVEGSLIANGGSGGTRMANGENGSRDLTRAPGGDKHNEKREMAGGDGSGGEEFNGGSAKCSSKEECGGGGGGAGRIRLNTQTGEAQLSKLISPAVSTECVSVGKLNN